MTQLFLPLCLALLVLVFTRASPTPPGQAAEVAIPDRCEGIEFDAITPDEKGKHLFFKDGYMWKGFHGPAQLSNLFYNQIGRVDAAFRMAREGNTADHEHVYLIQGEMVFKYLNQILEEGFPKKVEQEFPGVPCHLDAAVECPKGECLADSVLFFNGSEVYHYDIATRTVKTKTWPQVPPCTSALRWMEHYYCFQGNNFTRFNPVNGEVVGAYPKDARHYFMTCPNFGHGGDHQLPNCMEVKLDAITSDDAGKTYFFTGVQPHPAPESNQTPPGSNYMRLDTRRDGMHSFPITRMWPEAAGGVDAVFSYEDKMYFIKGDQVYIYRLGVHYSLIEGYPKTLLEELGIVGRVDAAFACPGEHTAHIIQGDQLLDVDLSKTPRTVTTVKHLLTTKVDAALCGPDDLKLFVGHTYYKYNNATALVHNQFLPRPNFITSSMMACRMQDTLRTPS